ncbi:MAG TPA: hypothetical protein CFH84_03460 [Sulfurimonas sp. UBA12504]|nr:MAG: hypothetical protein A2019_08505 [Sulfurimonas sp. GWF2_37_8]DAB30537.1 MAG TPA: hypothetical protein CFH84_03460 [Sulfurimonas sp. UBA12504]
MLKSYDSINSFLPLQYEVDSLKKLDKFLEEFDAKAATAEDELFDWRRYRYQKKSKNQLISLNLKMQESSSLKYSSNFHRRSSICQ